MKIYALLIAIAAVAHSARDGIDHTDVNVFGIWLAFAYILFQLKEIGFKFTKQYFKLISWDLNIVIPAVYLLAIHIALPFHYLLEIAVTALFIPIWYKYA